MRTDSTRISEEAKEMARKYITKEYGKEYLGSASPKVKKMIRMFKMPMKELDQLILT